MPGIERLRREIVLERSQSQIEGLKESTKAIRLRLHKAAAQLTRNGRKPWVLDLLARVELERLAYVAAVEQLTAQFKREGVSPPKFEQPCWPSEAARIAASELVSAPAESL